MTARARGIRLPEELHHAVEREMERSGRNWSQVVVELVEEAVRMRRAPGIVFGDGPAGRRALVAGTGLAVWEVIAAWRAADEDEDVVLGALPHLDERQLRAALGYHALYPDGIEDRLEREAGWTEERIRAEFPFASPDGEG